MVQYHSVEVKALSQASQATGRKQFRGIEELIFRAELALLLNGQYINSFDRSNLIDKLRQRLESQGIHAFNSQIERYLENVSRVFEACLAAGQDISALPFTNEAYKRVGRPPKRKKGKKRAILHNGQVWPSIKAAADSDPYTKYDALRKTISRLDEENRKRESIHVQFSENGISITVRAPQDENSV